MESEQKRALMAVILSGVVLFGWQKFFAPQLAKEEVTKSASSLATRVNPSKQLPEINSDSQESVKSSTVESDPRSLQWITLKDQVKTIKIREDLGQVFLKNSDITFSSNEVVGTQEFGITLTDLSSGKNITSASSIIQKNDQVAKLVFGQDKSVILKLTENGLNISSTFLAKASVGFKSQEKRLENGQVRLLKIMTDEIEDFDLSDSENYEGKTQWLGIDFNYHLLAVAYSDKQDIAYSLKKSGDFNDIIARQINPSLVNLDIFFVKKNYDDLIKLGSNLDKSVDFGVLGILAVPILRGLQFFYNVIPNYGVSIIILTILIRLITFPLQYKSFKSMKKMSTLQPEINKLKEKYKEDPQKLQRETMELFKRSGANPLGGCLPMLLQMPVFFAFYKVLYAAVELVGQPFYFWINDLSEKDPYFVLPVILTVAMFLQQKLTPTTSTDPTQQKVMMFMPIIFGFIMKDMPSGLVLYICVSTIFQMGQQFFVNKTA